MTTHAPQPVHPKTYLFTLRLWVEPWGDGYGELRMQVKHVASGETHYFRDWTALLTYLVAEVQRAEGATGQRGAKVPGDGAE